MDRREGGDVEVLLKEETSQTETGKEVWSIDNKLQNRGTDQIRAISPRLIGSNLPNSYSYSLVCGMA